MSKKWTRAYSARGLIAAAVATLMIFSGLPAANAGIIFAHIPKAGESPLTQLQAEDFSDHHGVKTEPTADDGGGENIGWIHDGDWTEYPIDIWTPGVDSSSFVSVLARVASNNAGGTIDMSIDGVHVGSIEVRGTGGWQNWEDASARILVEHGTGTLRLTYNGAGDRSLFNINSLQFDVVGGIAKDNRELAVDQMVTALESYGTEHGTFSVTGGDNNVNGQGWAFYKAGSHLMSTADILIEGGHLPPDPLHDELWTSEATIAGDVLIYNCGDRVGVFSREGSHENSMPSAADRRWWDTNGCNRYPIDQLGVIYFSVSAPL